MKKKIFVLAPGENWIVDRFAKEFAEEFKDEYDIITDRGDLLMLRQQHGEKCVDAIYLLADWCWRQIPESILNKVPVICSIHHIVPEKLNERDFVERHNAGVNLYHFACKQTEDAVKKYIEHIPYFTQPFWANSNIWRNIRQYRDKLRTKYNIPQDRFVIFSAQRDTEGAGISNQIYKPKTEKGPQLFVDYALKSKQVNNKTFVLLGGWRRQFIIEKLKAAGWIEGADYAYMELPPQEAINELYNLSDLYVVSSRWEGGPQAIIECALTETPIISTNVGVAPNILAHESIARDYTVDELWNCIPNPTYAQNAVVPYTIPNGFVRFRQEFEKLLR